MQGTLCCYCQLRPSYVWSPSSSARCLCKEKWWILMNHRATQAISCSRWGMRWWWGCKPCSQRTCENLMLQIYTSGGRGGTWVSTPTSKSEQVWLVLCRKWQPSSRRRTTAHLQDVNYQRKKKKHCGLTVCMNQDKMRKETYSQSHDVFKQVHRGTVVAYSLMKVFSTNCNIQIIYWGHE